MQQFYKPSKIFGKHCLLALPFLFLFLSIAYAQRKEIELAQPDTRFIVTAQRLWAPGVEEYYFQVRNTTNDRYNLMITMNLNLACQGFKQLVLHPYGSKNTIFINPNGVYDSSKAGVFYRFNASADCQLPDGKSYTLFKTLTVTISDVKLITDNQPVNKIGTPNITAKATAPSPAPTVSQKPPVSQPAVVKNTASLIMANTPAVKPDTNSPEFGRTADGKYYQKNSSGGYTEITPDQYKNIQQQRQAAQSAQSAAAAKATAEAALAKYEREKARQDQNAAALSETVGNVGNFAISVWQASENERARREARNEARRQDEMARGRIIFDSYNQAALQGNEEAIARVSEAYSLMGDYNGRIEFLTKRLAVNNSTVARDKLTEHYTYQLNEALAKHKQQISSGIGTAVLGGILGAGGIIGGKIYIDRHPYEDTPGVVMATGGVVGALTFGVVSLLHFSKAGNYKTDSNYLEAKSMLEQLKEKKTYSLHVAPMYQWQSNAAGLALQVRF